MEEVNQTFALQTLRLFPTELVRTVLRLVKIPRFKPDDPRVRMLTFHFANITLEWTLPIKFGFFLDQAKTYVHGLRLFLEIYHPPSQWRRISQNKWNNHYYNCGTTIVKINIGFISFSPLTIAVIDPQVSNPGLVCQVILLPHL